MRGHHVPASDDALADRRRPTGRRHGPRPRRHRRLRPGALRRAAGRGRARRARLRLPRLRRLRRVPAPAVSVAGQLADYRAALAGGRAAARRRPAPVWCSGASRSRAATCWRSRPGATTSPRWSPLTPLVDGAAAGRLALAHHKRSVDRALDRGRRGSRVAALRDAEPVTMPIVAPPGEVGALTLEGRYDDYTRARRPHVAQRGRRRGRPRARRGTGSGRQRRSACARPCSCRSPTSTAARRRTPRPRPRSRRGPRSATTPATTSTSSTGKRWFESAVDHQVTFLRRHLEPVLG